MDKIIISEQQIREMVSRACLDAINEGAFGDKLKSFGQKAVNAAKKGYQGGKALVQKGVDAYNKGMGALQQSIDNMNAEYGFDPGNNSEEDPEDNSQETSNPQPFPDLAKAEKEYLARKQQSQQQTQPQQTQPTQGWNDSQWTSSDTTATNYQNNATNNNEQPQRQTQSWDGNGYGEDSSIEESKKNKKTGKKVVKINESFIRQIIAETVKKVLKEEKLKSN